MIRWLKKHTKRSRKPKTDTTDSNAVHESRTDFLNHTYEEIPDVIPTGWRGIRSDSVPSFFLVGTSGVPTDSEDSMLENCEPYSVVSLSESLCSYETPTSCLDSAEELNKLGRLSVGSDEGTVIFGSEEDVRNKETTFSGEIAYSEETGYCETVYSPCSRDKLSCVRASCYHSHQDKDSSVYDNPQLTNRSTVHKFQYTKHQDMEDMMSLTSVSSLSSVCESEVCVSDVYSDDFCVSDLSCEEVNVHKPANVTSLTFVSRDKRSVVDRDTRRVPAYHPRLVTSRNRLLDDLIRGNYDRRMLAF